jgi:hypothetical protein
MTARYFNHSSLAISLVACLFSAASADILLVEGTAVRRYSDSGTFLSIFTQGLASPLGVTEAKTCVFIGQYGGGEIHKDSAEGESLGPALAGYADWQPTGLAWNDDRLYAASARHKAIASYATDNLREDGIWQHSPAAANPRGIGRAC